MKVSQVAVLLLILLTLGFFASPVTFGYVDSDSMEPTIEQGDMYILLPNDNPSEGDIITFYSPGAGKYITHRVVGTTETGSYLTKGDNNPAIDQEVSFSPVTEDQIVGTIPRINGEPIIVRGGGTAAQIIENNQYLLAALIIALYALLELYNANTNSNRKERKERALTYPQLWRIMVVSIWILLGLVLVSSTEVYPIDIIVVDSKLVAEQGGNLLVGEVAQRTATLQSNFSPFFVYDGTISGQQIQQQSMTVTDSEIHAEYTAGPYPQSGLYQATATYYAYPRTLPETIIRALHSIHPYLAVIATTGVIPAVTTLLAYFSVPDTYIRFPRRSD